MKAFHVCLLTFVCNANHVYPTFNRAERHKMMSLERKWRMHQHGRKRGFVLGGTTVVSDEQFPEYVSIWADQGDKAPSCGGFILDRYHIMTAANCGKFTKWAVAGTRWRLNTDKKPFNRLTSCSNAPGATSTSMGIWYKDYRICKLEMPLTFSKTINATILGSDDEFRNYVRTGQATCQTIGTGVTGITGSVKDKVGHTYKDELQMLEVKMNFHPHKAYVKPENFEMKATSTSGVCQGDNGGPLYCKINGVNKIFGITSWTNFQCSSTMGYYAPFKLTWWVEQTSDYCFPNSHRTKCKNKPATTLAPTTAKASAAATTRPTAGTGHHKYPPRQYRSYQRRHSANSRPAGQRPYPPKNGHSPHHGGGAGLTLTEKISNVIRDLKDIQLDLQIY